MERELCSKALLTDRDAPHGSVYLTKFYVVQKGDNFGKIATQFGTTANELKRLNPTVENTRLRIGLQIRVSEERLSL